MCSLVKVDNISISDYSALKKLQKIIEAYKTKTLQLESNSCKLSETIVFHLSLICELKDLDQADSLTQLIDDLIVDLVERTRCIFDPNHSKFRLIYGLSTFLDPSTKQYLDLPDNIIGGISMTSLKAEIIAFLNSLLGNQNSSDEQPANKKSCLLDSFLQKSTIPTSELSM